MNKVAIFIISTVLVCAAAFASDSERGLRFERTIKASRDAVWNAWTTEEGVKSFFAPASRIELEPGGWYEIYFNPKAEYGHRGAEGNRVLLVQPKVAFAFTWNAPETFPFARDQHTHVMIRLYPISDNETRLVLTQDGFGEGEDWDKVRDYFQKAWGDVVLSRLVSRLESARDEKGQ